jgi:cold shock CspA family protein
MDRGYGFIKTEQGGDLFFHRNNFEGVEFGSLFVGQEVEFEEGQDSKSRPSAVNVRLTETQVEDAGGDDQDVDAQGEDEDEV